MIDDIFRKVEDFQPKRNEITHSVVIYRQNSDGEGPEYFLLPPHFSEKKFDADGKACIYLYFTRHRGFCRRIRSISSANRFTIGDGNDRSPLLTWAQSARRGSLGQANAPMFSALNVESSLCSVYVLGMHPPPFRVSHHLSDWPDCRLELNYCRGQVIFPVRLLMTRHGDPSFQTLLRRLRCERCKRPPAPVYLCAGARGYTGRRSSRLGDANTT
jgi:hypothetical protein